jgi:hypothetical protein
MTTRSQIQWPGRAGMILFLTLGLLAAGCGEETVEPTSTQAAATTQVTTIDASTTTTVETTTTTMCCTSTTGVTPTSVPNPMTLLIAAADIGSGWVEEENEIPHPEPIPTTGVLCPAGQAIADSLASTYSAYRDQLWRIFVPEGLDTSTSFVSEILMQEEPDQNLSHFTTLVSALDACTGIDPWGIAPGWPLVRIERLDAPAMGDASYAIRMTSGTVGEPPWGELRQIGVRIGRFTIQVNASVNACDSAGQAQGCDPDPPTIDDAELIRITQAAAAMIADMQAATGG